MIVISASSPSSVYASASAPASLGGAVADSVSTQGTGWKDGQVVPAGGRVLCATAMGASVDEAQQQAYKLAAEIDWEGCFYRKDIGYRAIARERGENLE